MNEFSLIIKELRQLLPELRLSENEPLSRHTSFRIGGECAALCQPKSEAELMRELKRMTGEQMHKGQLTHEGMDAMAAKIAPMLTEQQRRRMQEVLRQLKG